MSFNVRKENGTNRNVGLPNEERDVEDVGEFDSDSLACQLDLLGFKEYKGRRKRRARAKTSETEKNIVPVADDLSVRFGTEGHYTSSPFSLYNRMENIGIKEYQGITGKQGNMFEADFPELHSKSCDGVKSPKAHSNPPEWDKKTSSDTVFYRSKGKLETRCNDSYSERSGGECSMVRTSTGPEDLFVGSMQPSSNAEWVKRNLEAQFNVDFPELPTRRCATMKSPTIPSNPSVGKTKQRAEEAILGIRGNHETKLEGEFPELPERSIVRMESLEARSNIPIRKTERSAESLFDGKYNDDFPELSERNCGRVINSTSSNQSLREIKPNVDRQPEKLLKEHLEVSPLKSNQMLTSFQFTPFPGRGTHGKPINLIANYYDLKCKLPQIYHYDVKISEVKKDKFGNRGGEFAIKVKTDNCSRLEKQQHTNVSKRLRQEVLKKFISIFKENKRLKKFEPIYDGGKNLFTARKLPIQDKFICNVPLEIDGEKKQYTISLKPVKKLDGTNLINMHSLRNWESYSLDTMNDIVFVLNAIMSHRGAKSPEIRVGRSFFSLNGDKKLDVGEGLEIWRGYNQSVHITQKGPVLVLNLAARAFHKAGEAIDYIAEVLDLDITNRNRPLISFEVKKIEKALKGVRVKVTHLPYPRKYYIKSVTKLSAEDFIDSFERSQKSIAQYFNERYGGLKFPHLNCFQMRTSSNKTYIPFEKCEILPGQPKSGNCDDLSKKIASEMIGATAVTPSKRFEDINNYLKEVNKNSETEMGEFQLFMDMSPKKVKGRVLDAPALRYSSGFVSSPQNGAWKVPGQFIKAQRFQSWILLSFASSQAKLERFASDLGNEFYKLGLFFNEFKGIRRYENNETTETVLSNPEVRDASLVVIVLSKSSPFPNYNEIKFIADYGLGLVTQCVLDYIVTRNDPRIITNICLKINTKLGGRNHELAIRPKILAEPVIIIGADVVHSTQCPSIAAVVGSMDAYASKYKVCCRVQENQKRGKKSQELILELESMVEVLLKGFQNYTEGKRPQKIIYFRDGVSEGQFGAVRYHEVSSIQNASKRVLDEYIPITFIVVQKRHQTRLRPENPKEGIGRGLNIPPGTTVDTDLTYPNTFDFFLCSHQGSRGTSKPSRYTVLHDDNNFKADELQQFSYDLCYLYGRCTKSLSIPAPVKYADLAAYRAKQYADFQLRIRTQENSSSSSSSSHSATVSNLPQYARDAINSMEVSKNLMFFI